MADRLDEPLYPELPRVGLDGPECRSRIAHESGVVLRCVGRHFVDEEHRSCSGVRWDDGDDRILPNPPSDRNARSGGI